jgi:hypothetical protein
MPMGGLFRVPKVAAAAATAAAPDAASTGDPSRAAADERRRRGLSATVTTSDRGVAASGLPVAPRKSLLGE